MIEQSPILDPVLQQNCGAIYILHNSLPSPVHKGPRSEGTLCIATCIPEVTQYCTVASLLFTSLPLTPEKS